MIGGLFGGGRSGALGRMARDEDRKGLERHKDLKGRFASPSSPVGFGRHLAREGGRGQNTSTSRRFRLIPEDTPDKQSREVEYG